MARSPRATSPRCSTSGALQGGDHALRLGPTDQLDWMKRQQRLTFARIGDHRSAFARRLSRPWRPRRASQKALAMAPAEVVEQVRLSGLRGRGGAGFPAGIKWKTVHDASADRKYVVCNADEGDSGTFADRMIFEGDPFMLIEGMAIAAYAVGATKGFIYLRSEYPHAAQAMERAIRLAETAGWIGPRRLRAGQAVRSRTAHRRRRLYLRRGDLPARKPRGQARPGARQAAAAGLVRPVRQADADQQRADARRRPLHPRRRREKLTPISAWAARAAPCPSSSAAISCAAG